MSSRKLARIILVLVFITLLAVPLIMKRLASRRERIAGSIGEAAALNRYGFHLDEVSHACGINFTHQAPTLDHRLDHIMPQVA